MYRGDMLYEVFIIKSGFVKLYDVDNSGLEKILHIVTAPSIIPFAFFSGNDSEIRWYYATLTKCELFTMPWESLRDAMKKDGALGLTIMNQFSTDMHELLSRLSSLGKSRATEKLAATLKFFTACLGDQQPQGWWSIPFPITHQLIADITGLTRESVTTNMKKLETQGIVRHPKQNILEIHKTRLRAL